MVAEMKHGYRKYLSGKKILNYQRSRFLDFAQVTCVFVSIKPMSKKHVLLTSTCNIYSLRVFADGFQCCARTCGSVDLALQKHNLVTSQVCTLEGTQVQV